MYSKITSETICLTDGCTISIETGKVAQQASGAVTIKMGATVLIATVVERKEKEKGSFLPLSVDYQEKFYARGKIPGGFLKREGRLTAHEILISRLIDRTLRPCFPENYFNTVHVQVSLISSDEETVPEDLAILAASSALSVSAIPFNAPVAGVKVGRLNGKLCINPTFSQVKESGLHIVVGASADKILMLEGGAQEIQEEELIEVIAFAHKAIKLQCAAQDALMTKLQIKKEEVVQFVQEEEEQAVLKLFSENLYTAFYAVANKALPTKKARKEAFKLAKEEVLAGIDGIEEIDERLIDDCSSEIKRKAIRSLILEKDLRIDGRKLDEIRSIAVEVDYLPRAHGSALFTRGETQVMSVVTLGSKTDAQMLDGVTNSGTKEFIFHYNFPSFSAGEARPNRGVSRRETGHGNLASRAISAMLPAMEEIPYVIRIVSEVWSCNGSTSMGATCSGSLALMDAGIGIQKGVSGIAMGVIFDPVTGKSKVISDILGEEDGAGDADFKITGTRDGITACQMDIKADGVPMDVLRDMLAQSKVGRLHILGKMEEVISKANTEKKPHAPSIEVLKVDPSMIGAIIGPRGKMIQEIQETTGATLNITDDGEVSIFGMNQEAVASALKRVQLIVEQPEIGKVYKAKVKSIMEYGAFMEFLPGYQGLLHISEASNEPIEDLATELSIDDEINVELIKIIKPKMRGGKVKFSLSRKNISI